MLRSALAGVWVLWFRGLKFLLLLNVVSSKLSPIPNLSPSLNLIPSPILPRIPIPPLSLSPIVLSPLPSPIVQPRSSGVTPTPTSTIVTSRLLSLALILKSASLLLALVLTLKSGLLLALVFVLESGLFLTLVLESESLLPSGVSPNPKAGRKGEREKEKGEVEVVWDDEEDGSDGDDDDDDVGDDDGDDEDE